MNFLNKKNMNMFVGLLSLLILLWLVMYFIPSIFVNLFDTTLGNFLLLIVVVMAGMRDMTMGVGLAVVLLVLYRFSRMSTMYMFEGNQNMNFNVEPLVGDPKKDKPRKIA
jgi:hypothetical protein